MDAYTMNSFTVLALVGYLLFSIAMGVLWFATEGLNNMRANGSNALRETLGSLAFGFFAVYLFILFAVAINVCDATGAHKLRERVQNLK